MNISTEMSEFFPYCSHLIDLKCVLIYDLKSDSNFLLCNMASSKGNLGQFWNLDSTSRIPDSRNWILILCQWNLYFGFQSLLGSGFQSPGFPDSGNRITFYGRNIVSAVLIWFFNQFCLLCMPVHSLVTIYLPSIILKQTGIINAQPYIGRICRVPQPYITNLMPSTLANLGDDVLLAPASKQ